MGPRILGWRERVSFPDLDLNRLQAKLDTGARTSSLHARKLRYEEMDGVEWVAFEAPQPMPGGVRWSPARTPVLEHRSVTDSGGHLSRRPVIETRLAIANGVWSVQLTLADRTGLRHPVLLGRRFLSGRFVVDPTQRNIAPESSIMAAA